MPSKRRRFTLTLVFLLLGPLRDEDEQRQHLLEVHALTPTTAADADAPVHH